MKTALVLFAILLTSKVHGSLLDGLEHHGHHGDHHGDHGHHGEHGEHHGEHGEHHGEHGEHHGDHEEHHGEHDAQHGEHHGDHGEQIAQQEHHAEQLGEHHGEHAHADEHSNFQTDPPAQKDDFASALASDISGGFLSSLPVAPARDVTPPARGVTTPPRDVTPPVRGITVTPRTSPVRGVTTPPRAVTPPALSFTTLARDVTPPARDITTPARAVTPTGRSFTSLDRTVTPPPRAVTTPSSAVTPPAQTFTTLDRIVTPPTRGVTTLDRSVTPPAQGFAAAAPAVSTPDFVDPAPAVAVHSAGVPPTESLVPPAPTPAEVFVAPASTPDPVDNFVTHTPAPSFNENLVQFVEEEQEEISPRENFSQKEDDSPGFVSSSGQGKQLASNDIRELQDVSGRSGSGDFPEYNAVPRTTFSCASQATGGYFADTEAQCQVFHICLNGQNLGSFLCPNGTLFHQEYFVCDWWFNVDCSTAPQSYGLNARIGVVPSDSE